jgi:hypothetical protein
MEAFRILSFPCKYSMIFSKTEPVRFKKKQMEAKLRNYIDARECRVWVSLEGFNFGLLHLGVHCGCHK